MDSVTYWIIVAIICVAIFFFTRNTSADSNKQSYRLISIGMWVVAAVLVITAFRSTQAGEIAWHIVLAIALAFGAIRMSGRADTAFIDQSSDEGIRVEIKQAQNAYKIEQAREAQIETEAQLEIQLSHLRLQTAQETELTNQAILETNRRELDLRNHLTEVGKEQGLFANDVSEVNKRKYLSEIELEENWKRIVQDLEAGDMLEIADQQVVNKLTGLLETLYRGRHSIEEGDDPPGVKSALLERYDKNIRFLEAKIDGRQTGLVLSENRKETLGLGEGEAQGSGRSSEETETD